MKLFEDVFKEEIKIINEQDELLDQHVRSVLSHALLGDEAGDKIKKDNFDLMVKGMCDLVWGIQLGKYKIKKTYSCRLDEMQCSEECHGSVNNKEKCSNCTVTNYITYGS